MNRRIQLLCVWAGPAFVLLYLLFFAGVARWVPPQPPWWSAERVAAYYDAHRAGIQIGQLGAMIVSVLLLPFWAVISSQIARTERYRMPVLALTQFGGAVLLQVFFALCSMLWIIATFRPGLDPSTVRALNDGAWLIFVMVFPGYVLQLSCIAIAAFRDTSPEPVWPRWAGYLNLWVALSGAGGGLAVFFKHGPFAWNGLIGFYVPVTAFVIWIGCMTYLLHRGITRQAPAERTSVLRA
jgi:hypothetical protein